MTISVPAQNKWGTLSIWSLYRIKYYSIDWVIHLASHSINISCSACFSIYLTLSWNLRFTHHVWHCWWLKQGGRRMHGPGKLRSALLPKSESSSWESKIDQSSGLLGRGTRFSESSLRAAQTSRVSAELWLNLKSQDNWDIGRANNKEHKCSAEVLSITCARVSQGAFILMPPVSHFSSWKNAKSSLILLLNQEYYKRTRAILNFTP